MRLIRHPVLCNYYLTYQCNARCSFCDIPMQGKGFANWKDVEKNLRHLKKIGVKIIDFTGGEPLLHPDLDRILMLSKELGFLTTVTSNAMLYAKRYHRFTGLIDMLHFSLDSIHREKHNEIRGVDCYDEVIRSIDIALANNERPDIIFTVLKENIHEIPELYDTLIRPKGLVLILNPVFDYNDVNTGSGLQEDDLDQLILWGKLNGVYLNEGFIQLRKDGGNKVSSPICKAASSTIVISPDNQLIVPCYFLPEGQFRIENNLSQLLVSSEVQVLRQLEGKHPSCEGCVINCYMQPSFAVEYNKYFKKAIKSTIKYNRIKRNRRRKTL